MAKKLTPWFSRGVQPAREGVYERGFVGGPFYALWRDGYWRYSKHTVDDAYETTGRSPIQAGVPWRGLSSPPASERGEA